MITKHVYMLKYTHVLLYYPISCIYRKLINPLMGFIIFGNSLGCIYIFIILSSIVGLYSLLGKYSINLLFS